MMIPQEFQIPSFKSDYQPNQLRKRWRLLPKPALLWMLHFRSAVTGPAKAPFALEVLPPPMARDRWWG